MKNPTEQRADERGADSGAASGSATWNFSAGGHPEAVCQDCSGPNVMWWAANDVWNKVIRPNGEITADPMLCPRCFIIRAKRLGLYGPWCVTHGSTESSPNSEEEPGSVMWMCPVCNHVMTEEQSKGYRGCPPNGEMHFAQHVPVKLVRLPNAELTHCAKKP